MTARGGPRLVATVPTAYAGPRRRRATGAGMSVDVQVS